MGFKLQTHVLLVIFLFLIICPLRLFAATYPANDILLNNNPVSWRTSPVNVDGLVYVPIEEMTQAVGMQGSFNIKTLVYSIKFEQNEIELKLDNSIASINGKNVKMPEQMKIINNRIMIPVKFFEQLGMVLTERNGKILVFKPEEGKIIYKVASGDFLWKISQMFETTVANIKTLNNLTSDLIYVGQVLTVRTASEFCTDYDAVTGNATLKSGPGFGYSDIGYFLSGIHVSVTGKEGLWYKVSTLKGNGYIYYTVIKVTQDIMDTTPKSTFFNNNILVDTSGDTVAYYNYTVVAGDTLWNVSENAGIPLEELSSINGLSTTAYLSIGQVIKIPIHTIAQKKVNDVNSGEILDWFTEARYVFPISKKGKVTDIQTGLSFNIQRTMGSSHSDIETLTAEDTQIMKQIFGGSWSWARRPFILEVDGRRFAVSISGMPHAGVDGQAFLANVGNRSGGYGYGPNYDRISGNQMDGHFDLYFLNCLGHSSNNIDPEHQKNVMAAGGLK